MRLKSDSLIKYFIGCWLFIVAVCVSSQPLTVGVIGRSSSDGSDITSYYEDVLRLALEKTRTSHGDFIIRQRPFEASVDRVRAMLQSASGVDVIWASATPERLQKMRYIDVNLLHDLNNYRALLIRRSDLNKFKKIETLEDLHRWNAGNGSNWTDTRVMQSNGFKVVTAVDFGLLMKMLTAKRFDFITRGLHEVGMDLAMFSAQDIAVVPNLLLKYSEPVSYGFFVRKEDEHLAQRLEKGVAIANDDGSLVELLERTELFNLGRNLLENKPRIIEIDNSAALH